jgi:uncharacterized membrane protein YqhA
MRSKIEKIFEKSLWNFRFVIIVVVIALLFSSLVAFYLGVNSTIESYLEIRHAKELNEPIPSNIVLVYLISSIDEFLLGIILIIISVGIYELFISKIDIIEKEGDKIPYPNWLTFRSLEDLKGVLTKVIIIILMVYFFKSVVVLKFDTPLSILYLGIGIMLIAMANYVSHKAPHLKNK